MAKGLTQYTETPHTLLHVSRVTGLIKEVTLPMSQYPAANGSIARSIAAKIEKMIAESELLPGQKIPSERQLCNRLSVSRSAVREALRELQARHLITTEQGKGSFVAEIIAQTKQSPLVQLYFDHNRTLYDLYEVRQQLEGQAAELAATRATKKDLYKIKKAFEAMENNKGSSRAQYDQAFHQAIAEASHNPVLIHVLSSLEEPIMHSVQASVSNLYHIKSTKEQMDKHHRQIYQAIIKGNPKSAQRAAIAHVSFVSKSLQNFEQQGSNVIRDALLNK